MTKITIREYNQLGEVLTGTLPQIALEDGSTIDQTVITSLPGTSAVFQPTTRYIEVGTDTNIQYHVAGTPAPGANSMQIFANTSKFIGVRPGQKFGAILSA